MYHLKVVDSVDDTWCSLIKDDPVRPEISIKDRVNGFAEILFLVDEQDEPAAVICTRYCSKVPSTVEEMLEDPGKNAVATFYSVWSYRPGSGGKIVFAAKRYIELNRPDVSRFVTLSPKTEMAHRFHIKNGAILLRENETTINYEYI